MTNHQPLYCSTCNSPMEVFDDELGEWIPVPCDCELDDLYGESEEEREWLDGGPERVKP